MRAQAKKILSGVCACTLLSSCNIQTLIDYSGVFVGVKRHASDTGGINLLTGLLGDDQQQRETFESLLPLVGSPELPLGGWCQMNYVDLYTDRALMHLSDCSIGTLLYATINTTIANPVAGLASTSIGGMRHPNLFVLTVIYDFNVLITFDPETYIAKDIDIRYLAGQHDTGRPHGAHERPQGGNTMVYAVNWACADIGSKWRTFLSGLSPDEKTRYTQAHRSTQYDDPTVACDPLRIHEQTTAYSKAFRPTESENYDVWLNRTLVQAIVPTALGAIFGALVGGVIVANFKGIETLAGGKQIEVTAKVKDAVDRVLEYTKPQLKQFLSIMFYQTLAPIHKLQRALRYKEDVFRAQINTGIYETFSALDAKLITLERTWRDIGLSQTELGGDFLRNKQIQWAGGENRTGIQQLVQSTPLAQTEAALVSRFDEVHDDTTRLEIIRQLLNMSSGPFSIQTPLSVPARQIIYRSLNGDYGSFLTVKTHQELSEILARQASMAGVILNPIVPLAIDLVTEIMRDPSLKVQTKIRALQSLQSVDERFHPRYKQEALSLFQEVVAVSPSSVEAVILELSFNLMTQSATPSEIDAALQNKLPHLTTPGICETYRGYYYQLSPAGRPIWDRYKHTCP